MKPFRITKSVSKLCDTCTQLRYHAAASQPALSEALLIEGPPATKKASDTSN